jgi:hypothetical protein
MLLERLVVGSTVEASLYALLSDSYFLSNRELPTLFFRELQQPILGFKTEPGAWSRLNFMLGLLGKKLNSDKETSPRLSGGEIKFISSGQLQKHKFSECKIFDHTGLDLDNDLIETKEKTYTVIDDFELSCLGKKYPCLEEYKSNSKFAESIHFYTSPRVDGADFVTDCVMLSTLNQEELNSFDYSDSIARFVVSRHLTNIGVHGIFMNNYKNGTPKYRKPKIRHVKRLVAPSENSIYRDTESVRFCKLSIEEILSEFSTER